MEGVEKKRALEIGQVIGEEEGEEGSDKTDHKLGNDNWGAKSSEVSCQAVTWVSGLTTHTPATRALAAAAAAHSGMGPRS